MCFPLTVLFFSREITLGSMHLSSPEISAYTLLCGTHQYNVIYMIDSGQLVKSCWKIHPEFFFFLFDFSLIFNMYFNPDKVNRTQIQDGVSSLKNKDQHLVLQLTTDKIQICNTSFSRVLTPGEVNGRPSVNKTPQCRAGKNISPPVLPLHLTMAWRWPAQLQSVCLTCSELIRALWD